MSFGGSSQPATTTTISEMPREAKALYKLAMPNIREYMANVPERYQGETLAGFTDPQLQGQQMALEAAGAQGALAGSAADATQFMMGNIWNPESNPNLQKAVAAATRPITENLLEKVLPGIRGEAITTGGYGGSRQGLAEGRAVGDAAQAIGDTASKLVQDQYATNVNAVLKAIGLTPTAQMAQTAPALTTSAVGDVQRSMEQALLDVAAGNYNYDTWAPYLMSKDVLGIANAVPGGTSTTTQTGGTSSNPIASGLGGASAGLSLASALGMGIPGIGWLGALGGGLLGALGSR